MKKILSNIYTLAALLMAGVAFTACSSSDDIIEQPTKPTEPQVYTMVIKASKGGDATTRALSLDGSTLNASWSGTETIEVGQGGVKIGTATAAPSPNGNTTITATLTKAPTTEKDIEFYLCSGNLDYTGQVGLLTGTNSISEKYDYAWANIQTGNFSVSGYDVNITNENFYLDFVNDDGYGTKGNVGQAIVKFTLVDKGNSDAPINATSLTIHASEGYLIQSDNKIGWGGPIFGDVTISPAGTTNVIYAALSTVYSCNLTLTATDGTDTYTYSKSDVTFNRGQYYEITVKMTKETLSIVNNTSGVEVAMVNGTYSLTEGESYTMSGIGSGNIEGNNVTLTIEDGTVLTGTMSTPASGQNNASIVLNGDFTLNGSFANYFAQGSDLHNYDAGYATITSGDGNYHTFNVNGSLACAHIYLAEHVTIRHNGELPGTYGYVKNADGSADITPSEETIGGVTYNVYVGSSGCGVVTVWINSWFSDDCYVVFYNDEAHVTLTDTGKTYENDYGQLLKCYTATLTAGATTYTVYDSWNNALASNVPVSDGDIVIYDTGGSSWVKKYW